MSIFKRKKKETYTYDVDGEILKTLDLHLDLIRLLKKDVKELMLNDSEISSIIIDQRNAIKDLQKQVNELQKLVNQNEGV